RAIGPSPRSSSSAGGRQQLDVAGTLPDPPEGEGRYPVEAVKYQGQRPAGRPSTVCSTAGTRRRCRGVSSRALSTGGKIVNPQKSDALSIVNASGFPFQQVVENEVNRTRDTGMHTWTVLFSEYPWADGRTGEEGFIDLALTSGYTVCVLECKRLKQGKWVFIA